MSDLDNQIIDFKQSMSLAATYARGDETTDVVLPSGARIPSIAKQAKTNSDIIVGLMPDLDNRLRLDIDGNYTDAQTAQGRRNLGLGHVDDTPDTLKPISQAVQAALNSLTQFASGRENPNNRNKPNGYPALSGLRLVLRNNADTVSNVLQNDTTVERVWNMPDKNGTVAFLDDITGTNSGNNTGDETSATIKAKLNISTLSGANTGDETYATILQKLNLTSISGVNTGDETRDRVIGLLGFEPLPEGAVGAANGAAPLDENGILPADRLPALFEAVVTYNLLSDLPNQGVDKRLYVVIENSGLYYWNGFTYADLKAVINNTDQLAEGQDNLYFTQLRAIRAVLTEFSTVAAADVTAVDTVVQAISKLQARATAAVSSLATKEVLANKVIDFSTINNTVYPTTNAVKSYLDSRMVGVLNDRGSWNPTSGNYPITGGSAADGSIKKGDFWYINAAGTLGGVAVNIGDSFRALVDAPGQTATNWDVLESNIGYVPENAVNKNASGGYAGLNGYKLILRNSGGSVDSFLSASSTVTRNWVMPDKDGTVAMTSDITGINSGTNTGDETLASIQAKLVSTTNLPEGTNKYYTDARAVAAPLTGYTTSSTNAAVASTDTVSQAFGKHQKQINDLQSSKVDRAGDTVGYLESDQTWHTTDVVKGDFGVESKNYLQAGGGASGQGGRTIYKDDGNVQRWMDGLNATAGTKNYQLYDLVNSRVIYSVSYTTGVVTFGIGLTSPQMTLQQVAPVLYFDESDQAGAVGKWRQVADGGSFRIDINTAAARDFSTYQSAFTISNLGAIGLLQIPTVSGVSLETAGNKATSMTAVVNNTLYPTVQAVRTYVDSLVVGAVIDCGNYDASVNTFPAANGTGTGGAIKKGNFFFISVAGTLGGVAVNVGDSVRALVDNPGQTAANWSVLESNLGFAPENSANKNASGGYVGLNGYKHIIRNAAGTVDSYLASLGTVTRNWSMPDKDGTVAMLSDITGTNSGVNTGDETQATIFSKITYTPANVNGKNFNSAIDEIKGADIPTASTINLEAATGNFVNLTGTVQVTAVTLNAGARRIARCAANQQFVNSANLVIQGNQTLNTKAGDILEFEGETGGVVYVRYFPMGAYSRTDKQKTLTASTATTALDLSTAGAFKVTLAANTSFTFDMSQVPALSGEVFAFSLIIINDATAGRGVSFPAGIKWAGGTIPPRTTAANARDDWYFYTDDGVNWVGSLANQDVK